MTELEQQIALCEWMGWKRGKTSEQSFGDSNKVIHNDCWISPTGYQSRKLPEISSLDVLHEMEKKLNENQRTCYIQHLVAIANKIKPPFFHAVIAPPNIRREALLRTIGKWRE